MTTWEELDARFVGMLGDAITHDSDLREQWCNSALRHFAVSHTARMLTATISAGDGVIQDFKMPSDFISFYSVYSEDDEMFLEPLPDLAGAAWDTEPDPSLSIRPHSWQEWPSGVLHMSYAPPAASPVVAKYFGTWPEFWTKDSDSDDLVLFPIWSHDAILTLALSNAYVPAMSDATFLNEFRTRVDSGNPLQNPMIQAHDAMIKKYEWLLREHPRQVREPYFRPGGRHR
jgi:hypothetical protein